MGNYLHNKTENCYFAISSQIILLKFIPIHFFGFWNSSVCVLAEAIIVSKIPVSLCGALLFIELVTY